MRKSLFFLSLFLMSTPVRAAEIPSFAEVKREHRVSDGQLLDRRGAVISEARVSLEGRALAWTALGEISPALPAEILQLEDKRFFAHGGVDWRALAGAAWQNLSGGKKRGASTLTMQLVSLLGLEGGRRGRRDIVDKFRQISWAYEIERNWKKDEILEAYLNLVPFRGEIVGVRAASFAFFGKGPAGLNEAESLFLAALLRSPNARAATIARTICSAKGAADCDWWTEFVDSTLRKTKMSFPGESQAFHLARELLRPGAKRVKTTIDGRLQRLVRELVADQVEQLKDQNLRDAAVLVIKNDTGEVLAYVGGSGENASSAHVDGVRARRQAGSTLKPFLYGLAWSRNLIGLASPLRDEPYEEAHALGSYRPENYDHRFHGLVPAEAALASSLNIPAVRLLDTVGVVAFHAQLQKLGFTELMPAELYGTSLALGAADVSLWELTNAYRALAREGTGNSPLVLAGESAEKPVRMFPERGARMVAEALSKPENRLLGFGWDNILSTPYPAAVKTGTSKDMRDNWCIGFTKEYTVGVWVGDFAGAPMHNVSGISGAAPIWRGIMDDLSRGKGLKEFRASPKEKVEALAKRPSFARIKYPQTGLVLAFDPDIPSARQRIPLEAEGAPDIHWKLNGELLGAGERSIPVLPGKFELSLIGTDGKSLDQVMFEVK